MAKKRKKAEADTGFSDITDAVAQAELDAQAPLLDPETGRYNEQVTEAQAEVARERAFRSRAASNGGPRSREWLLAHGVAPIRQKRSA